MSAQGAANDSRVLPEWVWGEPSPVDLAIARHRIELALAEAIVTRDEMKVQEREHPGIGHLSELYSWEVNGLCIALRLLGGYGTTTFDRAWADQVLAK